MIWYNQVLPHDVYDWDLQLPPILTKDGDRDLVLAAGKMGYVSAVDADDGALVWKSPSASTAGTTRTTSSRSRASYDQLPKLPITLLPGILGGVETQMAVADGVVYAPIVDLPTVFKTQNEFELQIAEGNRRNGRARTSATAPSSGSTTSRSRPTAPRPSQRPRLHDDVRRQADRARPRQPATSSGRSSCPPARTRPSPIVGDTLITAASFPQAKDQRP